MWAWRWVENDRWRERLMNEDIKKSKRYLSRVLDVIWLGHSLNGRNSEWKERKRFQVFLDGIKEKGKYAETKILAQDRIKYRAAMRRPALMAEH